MSAQSPQLMRASEVAQEASGSPMRQVLEWVADDLTRTHPDLGRRNAVCPFVARSLDLDVMWFAQIDRGSLEAREVENIALAHLDVFSELEPEDKLKTLVLVFPTIDSSDAARRLIDNVQRQVKPRFVEACLMIGELHPWNETPARANPTSSYRPNRSPVSSLAIRHMHSLDGGLLLMEGDEERLKQFYAAFMKCMSPEELRRVPPRDQQGLQEFVAGLFKRA